MPGVPARALLRRGRQLGQLAQPVVEFDQALHGQVQTAFSALRQQMVRRELATIPLARLGRSSRCSMRVLAACTRSPVLVPPR